MIKKWSI